MDIFNTNVSEGISHLVFYGGKVYKLSMVKCKAISSRRAPKLNDQVIMERTIALVLDPSTAKYLGRSLFYISSTGRVSLLVEQ